MKHHLHGHVYRNLKEADRTIALFGQRPPEAERRDIMEGLFKEREQQNMIKSLQERNRTRSRSNGRER